MNNQIKISTDALTDAIKKVKPAIPSNSALPSIEDVLIRVSGGVLYMTGTNLEMYITANLKVEGEGEMMFTASPEKLLKLAQSLPKKQMTLSHNEINRKLAITCDGITFTLEANSSDNYPKLPEIGEILTQRDLDKDVIDDCLTAIKFTSNDTLRPALTGVYFDYSEKCLQVVATNAHTLFVSEKHNGNCTHGFIVPAKALKTICAMSKKQYGAISFTETHCVFDGEDVVIMVRLIDARFVEYKSIIPIGSKYFSVNRSALLSTVTSMLPFANKITKEVHFELNGNLKIDVADMDFDTSASKEIPYKFKNVDDFHFAFNGNLLCDLLGCIPATNVRFYNDGDCKKAFTVRTNDSIMLIMPLMVGSDI